MSKRRPCHVEIVDCAGSDDLLLPTRVLINGMAVEHIAADGITVHVGSKGDPATVTLVLMPDKLTIRRADEPAAKQ